MEDLLCYIAKAWCRKGKNLSNFLSSATPHLRVDMRMLVKMRHKYVLIRNIVDIQLVLGLITLRDLIYLY